MTPNTHHRFFEVTLTIAIPDYCVDSGHLDVGAYIDLDPEATMLGYDDKELTLTYKEVSHG